MSDTWDAVLAGLVGALGLEWPAGLDAWEERLRSKLDSEVYAEYLEYRWGSAGGPGPDGDSTFYDFVGRHVDLALLARKRCGTSGRFLVDFRCRSP